MLNRKLFGSDIKKSVKEKLSLLQELNKTADFGEALKNSGLKDTYVDSTIHNFTDGGELSSRTPFVRMWTAVEVQKVEKVLEHPPTLSEEALSSAHGASISTDITVKDIAKDIGPEGSSPKVYMVGNHNMNVLSTSNPNASLTGGDLAVTPGEFETDNNDFFSAPAGITSVSSETEGTLGVIKKTTVNFVVNNFHDFDNIYMRYFLRPGAQIFVDYGWDTVPKNVIYSPSELIKENDIEIALYGEKSKGDSKDGFINLANGDMETLFGVVTDYNSKINSDGTVNCSLTITSKNAALLGHNFKKDKITPLRCKYRLDFAAYRDAVKAFLITKPEYEDLWTPDADTSADNIDTYNEKMKELFELIYKKSKSPIPGKAHVEVGLFAYKKNKEYSYYMSWGKFEDYILNEEFGLGEDTSKINSGLNGEARFNSIDSFTTFSEMLKQKQLEIKKTYSGFNASPSSLVFLYPGGWTGKSYKSYNAEQKDSAGNPKLSSDYPDDVESMMEYDKERERIPIREMFINMNVLKSAFSDLDTTGNSSENSGNLLSVLNKILTNINDASDGIFDWRIASDPTNKTITIVDNNQTSVEQNHNVSTDYFENLFQFNVMSSNTLVQDYSIDFKMPDGNIGNMIAIQSMGSGKEDKMFPATDILDDYLSIHELESIGETNISNIFVKYVPTIGGEVKAKKVDNSGIISSIYSNIYNKTDSLLTSDTEQHVTSGKLTVTNASTTGDIKQLIKDITKLGHDESKNDGKQIVNKKDSDENIKVKLEKYYKAEVESLEASGIKVTQDIYEYLSWHTKGSFFKNKRGTPLPLTLSLKIYGTSLITPGDIFRVNYLPKRYRDTVYFQVMKVSNEIGTSGWSTTYETQFRHYVDGGKNKGNFYSQANDFSLSPKTIGDNTKAQSSQAAAVFDKTGHDYGQMQKNASSRKKKRKGTALNFQILSTWMHNIKIVTPPSEDHWKNLNVVFKFVCNNQGDGQIISYRAPYDRARPAFGWFMANAQRGGKLGDDLGPTKFGMMCPAQQCTMEKGKEYHLLVHNDYIGGSISPSLKGIPWIVVDLEFLKTRDPDLGDLSYWDKIEHVDASDKYKMNPFV